MLPDVGDEYIFAIRGSSYANERIRVFAKTNGTISCELRGAGAAHYGTIMTPVDGSENRIVIKTSDAGAGNMNFKIWANGVLQVDHTQLAWTDTVSLQTEECALGARKNDNTTPADIKVNSFAIKYGVTGMPNDAACLALSTVAS